MPRRMPAMPWWFWAAGAAVLLGGSTLVYGVLDKNQMRLLLRDAARRYGVNEELPDAIGKIESGWNSRAMNCTGTDLARGCAIGSTQITWLTAIAHGYQGTVATLRSDPVAQADLTAKILAAGGVTGTSDAAAWWNAGKKTLAQAPYVTQTVYYPKLLAAHSFVRVNPPA